jgi:hypothetical protein
VGRYLLVAGALVALGVLIEHQLRSHPSGGVDSCPPHVAGKVLW